MIARDYQTQSIDSICAALDRGKRPILVLPTGGGKTFCGTEIVKRIGGNRLWLAHRKELVVQAARTLERAGLDVGIIKAGFPSYPNRSVQVASVQTLARRDMPAADLIMCDEVHHFAEHVKLFRGVLQKYPGVPIVGLTATPFRTDGQGLGGFFDEIIVGAYADELIAQKFIVEPQVYAPPAASLAGVKKNHGEYINKQLAAAIDKPKLIGDVVESWKKWAHGRPSLYFAVNVAHSRHIAEQFQMAGIRFHHVDGDTDEHEREDRIGQLADGTIRGLVNVSLFGEGVDVPAVKCVGLVRPTQSYGLFLQMVGRAVRPLDDDSSAVAIDHAGCFLRFGRINRRVEYTLDGSVTVSAPTDIRQCPKCFRIVNSGRRVCHGCGFEFASLAKAREMPEHADGMLQMYTGEQLDAVSAPPEVLAEMEDKVRRQEQEKLWYQLVGLARKRNYRDGWVTNEFYRRTKIWRLVPPGENLRRDTDREVDPEKQREQELFERAWAS